MAKYSVSYSTFCVSPPPSKLTIDFRFFNRIVVLPIVRGGLGPVLYMLYMCTSTVCTLLIRLSYCYMRGSMCAKSEEIRGPGITGIALCRTNTYNFINYNVPIEPHKTRRQLHPLFSIYEVDNSRSGQRGGL
jgi:hypothetical protein